MFDTRWLEPLTDDQRRAVTHAEGPLLVLAGAGTGKTTTLTSRVAWLIATGVPPERMLLLTFTRRAAREMLARTAALLATADAGSSAPGCVGNAGSVTAAGARRVRGGTFHSVAHATLRAYPEAVGLPAGFGVLDAGDAADVLREEAGLAASDRRFPRKATLLGAYSRTVNALRPLSQILTEHLPWCLPWVEEIAALFGGYVARKRSLGVVDLDDLLLLWRALAIDESFGPRLSRTYDHVLVDEYQDVNSLQVDVLRALRAQDSRLTAVGDDAQAVYGFRAATTSHVRNMPEVFPGTAVVVLERNHRSTQPVLDLANAVSGQMADAVPRTLRARPGAPAGARPELVVCHDETRQGAEVCARVLAHREAGIALCRQAVLVRAARHSAAVEIELARHGIPFVKYGGLRYLEAAHVKDLLAAFRLADNPADELAAFRVLQLLDGVGPTTARRLAAVLPDPDRAGALVADHVRPALDGLLGALPGRPGEPVATRGERLLAALRPLLEARYADAAVRLADLGHLVAALAGSADGARSLSEAAAELTLEPPASTADLAGPPHLDEEYLTVSTVHSAKGLEWDVVHVLHATEGSFPNDMALSTPAGLAEERRLFYVALTRARRMVHLYAPRRYHHRPRSRDDAYSLAQLSRFLTPPALAALDRTQAVERDAPLPRKPAAARVASSLDDLWR